MTYKIQKDIRESHIYYVNSNIEIYCNSIWKDFWETNQNLFEIPDVIPLIAIVIWFIIRCINGI